MSEKTVPCTVCGTPTAMTSTRLCDPCWERQRYAAPAAAPAAQPTQPPITPLTEQQVADMMKPEMLTDLGHRAMLNGERILIDLPWMTRFANFILGAKRIAAPMNRDAGMRCTYCCAKKGDPHADGCPEVPGGSIEQWHSGQPVPVCPICHDTGIAFGKVCECGK